MNTSRLQFFISAVLVVGEKEQFAYKPFLMGNFTSYQCCSDFYPTWFWVFFFPFRFNMQVDCIVIQACCCQRCCQNMSAKVHFPVVVPLLHYWRIQGNLTYTQPCKYTQTLELTLERYISFHFDLFYRLMIVKQKCVPIAKW